MKEKEEKKQEKVANTQDNKKASKTSKKVKETKEQKVKKEKKEKKENIDKKTKKPNKFIETIKKKWLIDGSKTILLVAIILAIFIGINILMQKWNLTPIDLSQEKLYTLTDESKEKVKNIDKEVKIYFIEYEETDSTLDLAKQYTKVNKNIKVEAAKANDRPDLVQKYGIESGNQGIIVECGEKYKVLGQSDLYTYDNTTYETINIAEEKMTAAIKSVTTEEVPKVYFLGGISGFSLNSGLQYLNLYLQNEIYEVSTVDVLTTGKVPDDCNTLVITSPSKDFDDLTTNAIIDYINSGRNILWLNAAVAQKQDLPNINKILEMYGVKPFEAGVIRETDSSKMVSGSPDLIMPDVQYSTVTSKLYDGEGVIFINATKINIADDEELANLNVTKTNLLNTSKNAYFRKNFSINSDSATSDEEVATFIVGAEMDKTISEANEETGEKEKVSKLIIFGESYFISDAQLNSNSQTPVIQYRQNKDLVLNSIAYLVDREEDITVRKSTGTVSYTATEEQNRMILCAIFGVPVLIILIGVIVWVKRRRK